MAPMMAMTPAHTMAGYYQVQPMQTQAFGLGQQPAMPNQGLQETQQFFQRFLTEQGPQIFQMFQQWCQIQTMQQQPMIPTTQLAQVFQQHPPPMNMGTTYLNPVVHYPHTPRMPRQTRVPNVGETPMTTPATLVQTTSATPGPSSRRVLRNASPRVPLKKAKMVQPPMMDTTNKSSKNSEHRLHRSKKNYAASGKFKVIDLTEPETVKVKQEVEATLLAESRDDPEPEYEVACKAREKMKLEKQAMKQEVEATIPAGLPVDQSGPQGNTTKQEPAEEFQPPIVIKYHVSGSDNEATKVKQNGKRRSQDAIPPESNADMPKTKKIKMKHEATQELQAIFPGGGGAHDRACPGCNALATSADEVTDPRVANLSAAAVDPANHSGGEGRAGNQNSHAHPVETFRYSGGAAYDEDDYSSDDMGSIHTESRWIYDDDFLW